MSHRILAQGSDTPGVELEEVVGEGLTLTDWIVAGIVFVGLIVLGVVVAD